MCVRFFNIEKGKETFIGGMKLYKMGSLILARVCNWACPDLSFLPDLLHFKVQTVEEQVRAAAEHKLGVANQSITAGFFDNNTRLVPLL